MGWVFQPHPLFSELQHRPTFSADILAGLPMGTWGQNAQSLFHTTCSQPTLCHLAGMSHSQQWLTPMCVQNLVQGHLSPLMSKKCSPLTAPMPVVLSGHQEKTRCQ